MTNMEYNYFPLIFKDLIEGSIYCFLSPLHYLRLSITSQSEYLNEYHSKENLLYNPLETFRYDPNMYQIMQLVNFRNIVKELYEILISELNSTKEPPKFLVEKIDWFNQTTFYCYFSESHRICIRPLKISAVEETNDGFEEAVDINRNCFHSQNNDHLINQFKLHLKNCQTISESEFINELKIYFDVIISKIDSVGNMEFPKIRIKLPDNNY